MLSDHSSHPRRLCRNGLASADDLLWAVAESGKKKCHWKRSHPDCSRIDSIFSAVPSAAIVYARPAEPYATVMDYLARTAENKVIFPRDSETRIFLTDLPVAGSFDSRRLVSLLLARKCVVIEQKGIVAHGADMAEACVCFAAACFAGFVKFFADALAAGRTGRADAGLVAAFERACRYLPAQAVFEGGLMNGAFENEADARAAVKEAGRAVVGQGLVDASFGNISYRAGSTMYITTSGSFLDDLEGSVVAFDLKTGNCAGGRPSSELPAHQRIAETTDFRAVLHGHPMFSVILSMDCHEADCPDAGECHRFCPRTRHVCGVPVIAGETGGGPYGLGRSVPPAVRAHKAAIVYGHGVFSCAGRDFNNALGRMVTLEQLCRKTYFEQIGTSIRA